jgi:hypothetical protein
VFQASLESVTKQTNDSGALLLLCQFVRLSADVLFVADSVHKLRIIEKVKSGNSMEESPD